MGVNRASRHDWLRPTSFHLSTMRVPSLCLNPERSRKFYFRSCRRFFLKRSKFLLALIWDRIMPCPFRLCRMWVLNRLKNCFKFLGKWPRFTRIWWIKICQGSKLASKKSKIANWQSHNIEFMIFSKQRAPVNWGSPQSIAILSKRSTPTRCLTFNIND